MIKYAGVDLQIHPANVFTNEKKDIHAHNLQFSGEEFALIAKIIKVFFSDGGTFLKITKPFTALIWLGSILASKHNQNHLVSQSL